MLLSNRKRERHHFVRWHACLALLEHHCDIGIPTIQRASDLGLSFVGSVDRSDTITSRRTK
jgi:hypothetical protein